VSSSDVLIIADSVRSADMRHAVPLRAEDPFMYAEVDGTAHVVVGNLADAEPIEALGLGYAIHMREEFGFDKIIETGVDFNEANRRLWIDAAKGLGVRDAVVPGDFPLEFADRLRDAGIAVRPERGFFDDRRRAKNGYELEGIRRAQRAAEAGLRAGLDVIRTAEPNGNSLTVAGEPLTVELVKHQVRRAYNDHGATGDDPIVAVNAQSALGHDRGSGPIAPRDIVLFDLAPRDLESHCFADMTRTFVVGEPSDEIHEYHRLCKEALERAIDMVRPAVNGREVYLTVAEFFHEQGYPTWAHKRSGEVLRDGFFHGLGHGVGLQLHEAPALDPFGDDLVPGDVVTLEPGLYRHGYGGVRLEDLILVTEDGAENLTDFPYELEI
jgi:Xaa-Pro aminopeptidase